MPTRNVVLTERQAEFVERLVSSGRYQNASEVLRDGLRLVESRDTEERTRLKALRDAARLGISDADAGRYLQFDSATGLRKHLLSMGNEAIADKDIPVPAQ
jgi:antitoxin ParD1/3/4